jgi:hypothetical protein
MAETLKILGNRKTVLLHRFALDERVEGHPEPFCRQRLPLSREPTGHRIRDHPIAEVRRLSNGEIRGPKGGGVHSNPFVTASNVHHLLFLVPVCLAIGLYAE